MKSRIFSPAGEPPYHYAGRGGGANDPYSRVVLMSQGAVTNAAPLDTYANTTNVARRISSNRDYWDLITPAGGSPFTQFSFNKVGKYLIQASAAIALTGTTDNPASVNSRLVFLDGTGAVLYSGIAAFLKTDAAGGALQSAIDLSFVLGVTDTTELYSIAQYGSAPVGTGAVAAYGLPMNVAGVDEHYLFMSASLIAVQT